jgi:hypothetical protein
MKIGFSLSPGGLLLPYHLGALASLSHHGFITDSTPLAGSSAGAIAVASHATGVPSMTALEASCRVSEKVLRNPFMIPSGGLLPALRQELHYLLPDNAHQILNGRPGLVALAHREVFPKNRPVMQTQFPSRNSLMDAICDSSMFPYFLTNQPVRMSRRQGRLLPRVVVDGFFACTVERLGCPDFEQCQPQQQQQVQHRDDGFGSADGPPVLQQPIVDRTIMLSVFPTELLSLTIAAKDNMIGPPLEEDAYHLSAQMIRLVRLATQGATRIELHDLYQQGYLDAEHWAIQESKKESAQRKRSKWKPRTIINTGTTTA